MYRRENGVMSPGSNNDQFMVNPHSTFSPPWYLEANHRHQSLQELFFDQFRALPSRPLLLCDKCCETVSVFQGAILRQNQTSLGTVS